MKISDRLIGTLFILLAIAILVEVQSFPVIPGQAFGSDLLPTIIAIGFILGGALLITSELRAQERAPLIEFGDWIRDNARIIMIFAILGGTACFIPLLPIIGFPILGTLLLLGLCLAFKTNLFLALPISIAAALIIHTLFCKFFLVPLPWGILEPVAW